MNAARTPVSPKKIPGKPTAADHSFLREVDDALTEERLSALWYRYRYAIVVAVIALLALTAGWQGWQAFDRHQALAQAEKFAAWQALPTPEARNKNLSQLIAHTRGGYHALAVFIQAQELAKNPTSEGLAAADRAYGQVYNDRNMPQWLREVARLDAALLQLGHNDTLAQEHLSILAQPPTNSTQTTSAVYPLALELLALMAQRHGDLPTAKGYTQRLLALPNLPNDLRQRGLARLGELSPPSR